jgi:hypothetical protein
MEFDPKLTILFLLIGAIVSLSYVGGGKPGQMRHLRVGRSWRGIMPLWRKG